MEPLMSDSQLLDKLKELTSFLEGDRWRESIRGVIRDDLRRPLGVILDDDLNLKNSAGDRLLSLLGSDCFEVVELSGTEKATGRVVDGSPAHYIKLKVQDNKTSALFLVEFDSVLLCDGVYFYLSDPVFPCVGIKVSEYKGEGEKILSETIGKDGLFYSFAEDYVDSMVSNDLVDCGCPVNVSQLNDIREALKVDESALMGAVRVGSYEIVVKLLDSGADPNAQDESGNSPLFAFIDDVRLFEFNESILYLLLDHGADPFLKNKEGFSFYDLAALSDSAQRFTVLLETKGLKLNSLKRKNEACDLSVGL